MKRQVTLRLDENMYKELRIYLLTNNKSFQKYVEELIEKDFNSKKNNKGDK